MHSINTRQLKLCRVPKTADSLPKCLEMSAHVFWLSLSFQHFRSCVDDRSVAEMKLRRHKSSCRQVLDLPVLRKSAQERSSDKILTSAIGHFHPGWSTRDDSAVTSCTEPKGTQCGPGMLPVAPSGAPKLCAEAWLHLSLLRPSRPCLPSGPHSGGPGAPRQPRQADRRTSVRRSSLLPGAATGGRSGTTHGRGSAGPRRWGSGTTGAAAGRNPQLSPLPVYPCSSLISVPRPEFAHPLQGDGDIPYFSPKGSRRTASVTGDAVPHGCGSSPAAGAGPPGMLCLGPWAEKGPALSPCHSLARRAAEPEHVG